MLFTWCMLAGLILLIAPQSITSKFQFTFARLFRWPLSVGRSLTLSSRPTQPAAGNNSSKQARYINHIANLEAQLEEKQRKIEMLSGVRERLTELERADLVMAEVITGSGDASRGELVINRGREDGVAKGQFVLADNSIIGSISDVGRLQAKVRLFTDPASNIEIAIAGLPINRVMKGAGRDTAKIHLVRRKYKVRKGDRVYVRKKAGYLDAPMIIGWVAECKQDEEKPLLWDITVTPACDLEGIKNVTVIIMNPPQ